MQHTDCFLLCYYHKSMSHSSELHPLLLTALVFSPGLLLAALGIPLMLGRVPPNQFYGVRVASAISDPRVWYPINKRGGRDLLLIGVAYTLLGVGVALAFRDRVPTYVILIASMLLTVAVLLDTFILASASDKLAEDLRSSSPTRRRSS